MSADAPILPAGRWRVVRRRSRVGFAVGRRGLGVLHGAFTGFEGELAVAADGAATARGAVRADSVDTGDGLRDDHLRGAGFLDAERHPRMTFAADAIGRGEDGAWAIDGALTIRGVTRPLRLDARVEDVAGRDRARRLRVAGELDRRDFGLAWGRVAELAGGVATRVRVELDLEVEPAG
ncbi:MAG: YceI family protein [Solirubrobacteraceae bacterium]|nr:YceI family protein [Solirubrobacteraceae bacterium]